MTRKIYYSFRNQKKNSSRCTNHMVSLEGIPNFRPSIILFVNNSSPLHIDGHDLEKKSNKVLIFRNRIKQKYKIIAKSLLIHIILPTVGLSYTLLSVHDFCLNIAFGPHLKFDTSNYFAVDPACHPEATQRIRFPIGIRRSL